MGKIKICFYSGDITRSGGTERVSSMIANRLWHNNQFEICFLSLWEKKQEPFFFLEKEINRFTLYDRPVSGAIHLLGWIHRTRKFVREHQIDILIDIDGILDLYSVPALWGTKTKLISWEQFNYYQNPDGNYRKLTRRMAAKWADAIVVLTEEDKGYYEKNLKIRHIIRHIYNPMIQNEATYSYDTESKMIISAGRLTYQKGFDILADVAAVVLKKHKDWTWVIAGEGEDRPLLEEKIRQYGLEKQLILCGNIEQIETYYQRAAFYVLTSRFEGFGLVLTEAKAFHLPCISFRCPAGPAEIIEDNVNGYLVDCFDQEDMAQKICRLIEDSKLRQQFSQKALEGTEKFEINAVAEQWKKLFEELMNGRKES